MTRRELRENTFKMLFRVEFHKAEEIPEQFTLFEEEIAGLSDEDRTYHHAYQHSIEKRVQIRLVNALAPIETAEDIITENKA